MYFLNIFIFIFIALKIFQKSFQNLQELNVPLKLNLPNNIQIHCFVLE